MITNSFFPWIRLLACILTPLGALCAEPIYTSNSAPLIIITDPTNHARFVAPADLVIAASLNDPDRRAAQVKFFANTNLIGIAGVPLIRPRVIQPWSFVPVGEYSLIAVACAESGESLGTSAPVKITVEFSCESGIVILPGVSGRVRLFPELGVMFADANEDLQPLQSMYDKTTADNREFRRGFAEFAIPVLPVRFSSADLVLTMSPQGGELHELSYYAADLTIGTNDFDQPTIPWTTFQRPPSEEEQTLRIDVTSLVTQFAGGNLGFRLKLAVDPIFDEIASLGAGFDPPRLVFNTCSNPPPHVNIWALDPIASESRRGGDPATYIVWRTGPANSTLPVHYSVKGTAANGIDYQTLPGVVTIPAGGRSARILLQPMDDRRMEHTESVMLNLELTPPILDPNARLSLPPPYLLGPYRRASAFIFDNDRWPWLD